MICLPFIGYPSHSLPWFLFSLSLAGHYEWELHEQIFVRSPPNDVEGRNCCVLFSLSFSLFFSGVPEHWSCDPFTPSIRIKLLYEVGRSYHLISFLSFFSLIMSLSWCLCLDAPVAQERRRLWLQLLANETHKNRWRKHILSSLSFFFLSLSPSLSGFKSIFPLHDDLVMQKIWEV